jgi:hypothetical protein
VRHLCTCFDSRFLPYGLALYESLREHARPFTLHVLCFDAIAYDYLAEAGLEGVRPIRFEALEAWDPALPAVKPSRSKVEYFFTCTPSMIRYVMEQANDAVTYLDADLYFFADPSPIYSEIGSASVGIFAHRYRAGEKYLEVFGIYNVGFLYFRNDAEGGRCLAWWRERCLEWCFDRVEDGKFADQKYLDQWPSLFNGVVVIQNPGAGLAPWNEARFSGSAEAGNVSADGAPLIFYHFHGLRFVYDALLKYSGAMTRDLRLSVYAPYIRELRRLRSHVNARIGHLAPGAPARTARSIVSEQLLLVAGPVILPIKFNPVLRPVAAAYRSARRLLGVK